MSAVGYRCLACGHEWVEQPRPVLSRVDGHLIGHAVDAEYPRCGHLYLDRP